MTSEQADTLIAAVGELGTKLDALGAWCQAINLAVVWCFIVLLGVFFWSMVRALKQ